MQDGSNGDGVANEARMMPTVAAAAAAAACILFLSVACIVGAVVVGFSAMTSTVRVVRGASVGICAGVTVVLVDTVVVVASAVLVLLLLLLLVTLSQASSDKCWCQPSVLHGSNGTCVAKEASMEPADAAAAAAAAAADACKLFVSVASAVAVDK